MNGHTKRNLEIKMVNESASPTAQRKYNFSCYGKSETKG